MKLSTPLYFFFHFIIHPYPMPPSFEPPYAVPVPNATPKPGETVPMRHFKFADKLVDHPPNVTTMWDLYLHGNKIGGGDYGFLYRMWNEKERKKNKEDSNYPVFIQRNRSWVFAELRTVLRTSMSGNRTTKFVYE